MYPVSLIQPIRANGMTRLSPKSPCDMMTSSNGRIFRVTGPLWGESIGHRWIPHTKASDADVYFDLRLNKQLRKQSRRRWFETESRSLWRYCNGSTKPMPVTDTVNGINQGWGLLNTRSLISPLAKFSIWQKYLLHSLNHAKIWQVSPQLS